MTYYNTTALHEEASLYGTRSRWKQLISHLSIKDIHYGTTCYDYLCITLINCLIASIEAVEARIEERRILNGNHDNMGFENILHKLEDKIRNDLIKGKPKEIQCLETQIEAYFALSQEDSLVASIPDENGENGSFNLSNPKELFCRVEKQAISEGYINELTSILSNLLTIPATQSDVWHNISRIVGEACHAKQVNMLKDCDSKMIDHDDIEQNYFGVSSTSNGRRNVLGDESRYNYPNYKALKLLLNVKDEQDEKSNELKTQLETERNNKLKLEQELNKLRREFDELKSNTNGGAITKAQLQVSDGNNNTGDDGYNKYRKMLKIRLPVQSVANKMIQDGIDATIIAAFEDSGVLPNGNAMKGSSSTNGGSNDKGAVAAMLMARLGGKNKGGGEGGKPGNSGESGKSSKSGESGVVKLTEEEEKKVCKYRKMLKIKMPEQSVKNRMRQDGVDKALINKMFGTGGASGGAVKTGTTKKREEAPSLVFFFFFCMFGLSGKKCVYDIT